VVQNSIGSDADLDGGGQEQPAVAEKKAATQEGYATLEPEPAEDASAGASSDDDGMMVYTASALLPQTVQKPAAPPRVHKSAPPPLQKAKASRLSPAPAPAPSPESPVSAKDGMDRIGAGGKGRPVKCAGKSAEEVLKPLCLPGLKEAFDKIVASLSEPPFTAAFIGIFKEQLDAKMVGSKKTAMDTQRKVVSLGIKVKKWRVPPDAIPEEIRTWRAKVSAITDCVLQFVPTKKGGQPDKMGKALERVEEHNIQPPFVFKVLCFREACVDMVRLKNFEELAR